MQVCIFFVNFAAKFNFAMALARTYYRVAEHLFAVESSNTALFDLMSNYEPFAVEINKNENIDNVSWHSTLIFTLRIELDETRSKMQEAKDEKKYIHVLTDNAEEYMPRVEVYKAKCDDVIMREGDRTPQKSADFSGMVLARGWLFRVAMVAKAPICCEMECCKDFTVGVLRISYDCQNIRFCIDNSLMLLYAFRTAPLMTLEMHAAVVVRGSLEDARGASSRTPSGLQDALTGYREEERGEGRGYLFLGHSGTGKSTHARQWLAAFDDAWLLNDDNPIVRVMENNEVLVYGSPWSGKTPCYKNSHARVGGIIKLSQASYNRMRMLSLPEAYAYILSSTSGLKMDRQMTDYMHETIKHVIMNVKCHHLECLPNTEAAAVCFHGVGKQCLEDDTLFV